MEVVSKPCQDRFLHPILVHSIIEKKENTGSQMGRTKKIIYKNKKKISKGPLSIAWKFQAYKEQFQSHIERAND